MRVTAKPQGTVETSAAKPQGTACLDDPHCAPITYFDNPMTGFANCNKKLPAQDQIWRI